MNDNSGNAPKPLCVNNLLNDDKHYIIPIYQRNYAWEEGEITQLIEDIIDYLPKNKKYYIGTLVIYERRDKDTQSYEVIDGQQRLTTLSLIALYLKNTLSPDLHQYKKLNIEFDCRKSSQATFQAIFNGKPYENSDPALINSAILNGYQLIEKILPQKVKEHNITIEQFSDYLFDHVTIMQVKVPDDTDLNHYFEIMNSRGEQLEKHEILKAQLIEKLQHYEHTLNTLWESCSDMQSYVQMSFSSKLRLCIFSAHDQAELAVTTFDDLHTLLSDTSLHTETHRQSLTDIIENISAEPEKPNSAEKHNEDRFSSVINFPNFLLHVLQITIQEKISLDDKFLLEIFDKHLLQNENPTKIIKQFFFNLLRCRYLFDQYVIKRELTSEAASWSLKRLNLNDGKEAYYVNSFNDNDTDINHQLLMLLSAFHVSAPSQLYKYWLNSALTYLFFAETFSCSSYLNHMHSTATAFLFDRFLCSENEKDYFDIIQTVHRQTNATDTSASPDETMLCYGHIKNNFVFNFLDYLLWRDHKETDKLIRSFHFTFRSSVEHYYPRNPRFEADKIESKLCDTFGNLCLISAEKNSSLGNLLPSEKQKEYKNKNIDSIKQYLMMREKTWDENTIKDHTRTMTALLLNCQNTLSDP